MQVCLSKSHAVPVLPMSRGNHEACIANLSFLNQHHAFDSDPAARVIEGRASRERYICVGVESGRIYTHM